MTIGSGIAVVGIWIAVAGCTFANPMAGFFIAICATFATIAIVEN